jgi:uncharacterized repeat protein (TIGR01451 family)
MKRQVWVLAAFAAIALLGGRVGAAQATDPSTGDPVVAAVGDMACAPADSHFNGGAGTTSNCGEVRTAQQMETDSSIDVLLGLGDYQYGCGTPAEFAQSYGPSWGFFNSVIDPSAGNHEYSTTTNSATGTPCPDPNTAGQDYFTYFGSRAHPATAGEYSFNLGSWHLISLNANCSKTNVGGCSSSSPQTQWLSADLAANSQPCVLAYWHQPRWTATSSNNSTYNAWWNLLYAAHADLVLNGHIHTYARFAPLTPAGAVDTTNGITEVIVGTGGESLQAASSAANPKPLNNQRLFGYLRMVLQPTGYTAAFVTSSGATKDSFSGTCHGAGAPPKPLTISQSASAESVQADSPVTHTVTVTNPGTADQTNVVVTDTPPAADMNVSASASQGSCSSATPIVCSLGTLTAGASATITVTGTPIMPPTATNGVSVVSDQTTTPVTGSKVVTVTAAAATSYVGITSSAFGSPSPALVMGNTVQWSFLGPGQHSATDQTTGLGLWPDTGLVTPVDFRTAVFPAAGGYTFTDTATGHTIKLNVPMTASPSTGSTSTAFTLTWAASPPPAGYAEDIQVTYPGTSTWVTIIKATTATSGTFTPANGTGKYIFRARFRAISGSAASSYTTNASITVS